METGVLRAVSSFLSPFFFSFLFVREDSFFSSSFARRKTRFLIVWWKSVGGTAVSPP